MQIVRAIVRILIGLLFLFAGVMTFLVPPPPQPGLLGSVSEGLYLSHWSLFVAFAQIVVGVLFLANRYMPLALVILFAFFYNSFAFHLGTSPMFAPLPIIGIALAVFIGWPYRRIFAILLQAKPRTDGYAPAGDPASA